MPPRVPDPRAAASRGNLTARESEVAELVAMGLSNRLIAEELFVSEKTAASHVEHILAKLGLNNRVQIANFVTSGRSRTMRLRGRTAIVQRASARLTGRLRALQRDYRLSEVELIDLLAEHLQRISWRLLHAEHRRRGNPIGGIDDATEEAR